MTRRARRRVEAVLVLLAFPAATALTALAITSPGAGSRADPVVADVAETPRVSLVGGDAIAAFGLADELGAEGYDIVAVGPDEKSLGGATQVVYYERADRRAAERLRNLLGVGTIHREQVFAPGSDLTILIGKDLQST